MTKLIHLDAALAALDSHAHGTTTLGGQTYRSITLEVAVEALQAIPTIDPAAIREAALKEAADHFASLAVLRKMWSAAEVEKAILALIGKANSMIGENK